MQNLTNDKRRDVDVFESLPSGPRSGQEEEGSRKCDRKCGTGTRGSVMDGRSPTAHGERMSMSRKQYCPSRVTLRKNGPENSAVFLIGPDPLGTPGRTSTGHDCAVATELDLDSVGTGR